MPKFFKICFTHFRRISHLVKIGWVGGHKQLELVLMGADGDADDLDVNDGGVVGGDAGSVPLHSDA